MNKYQKALDTLSYPLEDSSCGGCKCGESDCNCEKREAIETLQELVDRATPKQPIMEPWSPARCPSCGTKLSVYEGDGYYRHSTFLRVCPNNQCRQVLKWSDDEYA